MRVPTLPNIRKISGMSPSSASIKIEDELGPRVIGTCLRQQFYKQKGCLEDKALDVNVDWILAAVMGDKMHEFLVELIDHFGYSMGIQRLAKEHSIYNEKLDIKGRCDLIAWDYNNKEPIGIEIKSIGEFKAKKAMEQPVEEHVLQSIVYLNHYNNYIPWDQKKITKWYLWYICRTENWSIKSKLHQSEFTNLWDFCIELDNGVPIIRTPTGNQKWNHFSVEKIYDRYKELQVALETNSIPPRDYQIRYSEEKILGMHKLGRIVKKADIETIEKWEKKGAIPGKLKVDMGDFECAVCDFRDRCWIGKVNQDPPTFSNFPIVHPNAASPSSNFVL